MNCRCVSQKIGSYLDGELSGTDMIAIRSHLQRCDACAEEAESLRSFKSSLSSLPMCEVPEGLEERLMAAVRSEIRPAFLPRRRGLVWSTAIAFAAAAGFLGVWFGLASGSSQSDSPAIANHDNGSFELSRDQAFQSASDPLGGHSMVVTASYGQP